MLSLITFKHQDGYNKGYQRLGVVLSLITFKQCQAYRLQTEGLGVVLSLITFKLIVVNIHKLFVWE